MALTTEEHRIYRDLFTNSVLYYLAEGQELLEEEAPERADEVMLRSIACSLSAIAMMMMDRNAVLAERWLQR